MSVPELGPKKVRKLAVLCGLDLNGAWSGNSRTAHVRTRDHRHLTVDRKTGAVLSDETDQRPCFTDCPPATEWPRGIASYNPEEWSL